MPNINSLKERYQNMMGKKQNLEQQYSDNQSKIDELNTIIDEKREQQTNLKKVSNVMKQLVEDRFNQQVKQYKDLIERGLNSIFHDRKYGFKVDVDDYGQGKRADLLYREQKEGEWTEWRPLDSGSGAVRTAVDVISRVFLIKELGKRRFLFFDESLNAIAGKYLDNFIQFLETVCENLRFDVMLISHDQNIIESIPDDSVFEVKDGRVESI